jgi:hypothetical protein
MNSLSGGDVWRLPAALGTASSCTSVADLLSWHMMPGHLAQQCKWWTYEGLADFAF